uniref:cation-transporting P-type ATPase n=1 Tax=uncultured Enterococcus sp. TaxID=167972 RepID=UPI0025AE76BA
MEKKKDTQKIYAAFAGKTKQELFDLFHASANGLTEEQIERSRENYGENAISYGKKTPFIVEILKAYITPFTLVLIALGIISFNTEYVLAAPGDKDLFGVAIIFTMVIVSGTMTLIQSVRSNQAAEKLKSLVKVTAAVKRNGKYTEIPMEEIVCGDLVRLSAGDM